MTDVYTVLDKERKLTTNLRDYKKLCLINSVKSLKVSIKAACEFFDYSVPSYYRIKKEQIAAAQNQSKKADWGGRRKAYMSLEQEKEVAKELAAMSESGGFVDIGKIKELMERIVGKTLHKTTVYRFLERHAFRKIAPRKYHPKRNEEAQEEFKKNFPAVINSLSAQAKVEQKQLVVLFQDEASFGRVQDPKRCWVPKKNRPLVKAQAIRQYIYAYGAVNPVDGTFVSLSLPRSDTYCMNLFLEEVASVYPDALVVIFLDQAAWHKSKALKMPPNIRLLYIPSYSPELNPTEIA